MKKAAPLKPETELAKLAAKALKRSAKRARETARQHGTPLHVQSGGKLKAIKP